MDNINPPGLNLGQSKNKLDFRSEQGTSDNVVPLPTPKPNQAVELKPPKPGKEPKKSPTPHGVRLYPEELQKVLDAIPKDKNPVEDIVKFLRDESKRRDEAQLEANWNLGAGIQILLEGHLKDVQKADKTAFFARIGLHYTTAMDCARVFRAYRNYPHVYKKYGFSIAKELAAFKLDVRSAIFKKAKAGSEERPTYDAVWREAQKQRRKTGETVDLRQQLPVGETFSLGPRSRGRYKKSGFLVLGLAIEEMNQKQLGRIELLLKELSASAYRLPTPERKNEKPNRIEKGER